MEAGRKGWTASLVGLFEFIGENGILFGQTARFLASGALEGRETVRQMSLIGVNSLPIALITTAFSAAVLSLQSAVQLVRFGQGVYVGGLVAASVAREVAPVLTGVVVAARAGAAIAAEVGTMKVTEQVDALRALAVHPVEYLVVPRFLALVLMLPVLTLYADVVGNIAGYLVAVGMGVPSGGYLQAAQSPAFVRYEHVLLGLAKTLVFGAIIALVACQQGLRARGGAAGVGRATTNAVVLSVMLIYISNYFLSELMFT
ncbi:MAG: ABC transporter permease [Armatimonadetes bacterium]|jgi:phospholipid/cholesterol/gamma-HCH transport system permease protein|nr:ABC transporter permease [Armatimonadota bacterium]